MKIIILIATISVSSSVYADNCDKPRDDFDSLYCLNKIYQESDKELNMAYKELQSLLDNKGLRILKETQIKWIKSRNNNCSLKKDGKFFISLGCTTKMTVSRTNILRNRIRECKATGCQTSKL